MDRDEGSSQEDLVETLDKNQIRVTRTVRVQEYESRDGESPKTTPAEDVRV